MKTIYSAQNGAFSITEEGGKVMLNLDESLGGGDVKGIVSGKASIVLDGEMGIQAGEKLLNAHLPPAVQPFAIMVETVANQALKTLE